MRKLTLVTVLLLLMPLLLSGCKTPPKTPTPLESNGTQTVVQPGILRLDASILPQTQAKRGDTGEFTLKVTVYNQGADAVNLDIVASCGEGLEFFILPTEFNQTVGDGGRKITHSNVLVEAKINDVESYKTVLFGFHQTSAVMLGTHNLRITAISPNLDPVSIQVVYKVTED